MENDSTDDSDSSSDYECPFQPKCSDSVDEAYEEPATVARIQSRMGTMKGISGQFIEDVNVIIEKCGNIHYVVTILHGNIIYLAKDLKGDKGTITVEDVKRFIPYRSPEIRSIDEMHIFQAILLRELPPERFGALINLISATDRKVTNEEIEDSLRYLYGTGPYVKVANIPPLPSKYVKAKDFNNKKVNKLVLKNLKSLVDLRPQVVEHITEIFEKFRQTRMVSELIYAVIDQLVYNLHGDTAKIDFPTIKEYTKDIDERAYKENNITVSIVLESILLTRLDEEVYCGLINVMNTFDPSTSDNDIKKALEYLYGPDDVESKRKKI